MSKKPSIARLHAPTDMRENFQSRLPDGSYSVIYGIANETGGRVDYYTIDAETGEVELVRSTSQIRGPDNPYLARKENLFRARDDLFPKGVD